MPMIHPDVLTRLVKTLVVAGLLGLGGISAAAVAADARIRVEGAWVRALPAVSRVSSAYMTIHNPGEQDDRLLAATTAMAGVVEIHLSQQVDGMARMQRVESLVIPAGQQLSLRSGEYHLMLQQLHHHPNNGDRVLITLTFEHAGELQVEAQVRSSAPEQTDTPGMAAMHHGEMKHSSAPEHDPHAEKAEARSLPTYSDQAH